MMRRAAAIAGVLACASSAHAWSRFHAPWELPVHYRVANTLSGDLGEAASLMILDQGVNDWARVSCTSLRTQNDGRTSAAPNAADGQNVMGWVEDGWGEGSGVIGQTSFRQDRSGNAESDIAFNGVHFTWIAGSGSGRTVNAYTIVLHEAGHFFGIGHSNDTDAVMFASYSGGIGALSSDDQEAICTLYPGSNVPPPDCTTAGCPSGQDCVGGTCVDREPAAVCAPCTASADCGAASSRCLRYPDGGTYCGRTCTSDSQCGTNGRCLVVQNVGAQCVRVVDGTESCAGGVPTNPDPDPDPDPDPGVSPTGQPDGSTCTSGADCASGLCVEARGMRTCTSSCDSTNGCDDGWSCETAGSMRLCMPGGALGDRCSVASDCATGLCIASTQDEPYCSRPCGSDACPSGFACDATGSVAVCRPADVRTLVGNTCRAAPGGAAVGPFALVWIVGGLLLLRRDRSRRRRPS